MAIKKSPISHKVSFHLLRLSLLIHKLRKPIIPKLKKKSEELKLLNHYNYEYGEYQFSASSTLLIHRKNRGHRGLLSFLHVYCCFGNFKVEGSDQECQMEALSLSVSPFEIEDGFIAEDEAESVDEKAERFIQSFYHQIRMQTQESL